MPYVRNRIGVNLTQIDESGANQFDLRTVVELEDASSVDGRDKLAIYVVAEGTITASENCLLRTSGTVTGTAGGYISQANATVLPGQFFWVKTSAVRI